MTVSDLQKVKLGLTDVTRLMRGRAGIQTQRPYVSTDLIPLATVEYVCLSLPLKQHVSMS